MNEPSTKTNSGSGESDTKSSPPVVTSARWLFVLLGLTWLVIGIASIFRLGTASSVVPEIVLWIFAALMFINALLLFWLGWGIGRDNRLYYYFGILLLAVNVLLTLMDDFGTLDLITLVINISLLVLLIGWRSIFLSK